MALVETGKVKINVLNAKGLGTAISPQKRKIALAYTLPGDVVEFEHHQYRNKKNSIVTTYHTFSEERTQAECKYFTQCGGCLLQHLPPDSYQKLKQNILIEALNKYDINSKINPLITIGKGKRRRANFEYIKFAEKSVLGFHKYHFNQIVNLDSCLSVRTEISEIIPQLKELLDQITEIKQKANVYITLASNGIDLLIRLHKDCEYTKHHHKLADKFCNKFNICRFKISYKKKVLYEQKLQVPYILYDNIAVEINSDCFLQATFESDKILKDLVINYLKPTKKDRLIDLFCGRGTFTIPLSQYSPITGLECEKSSIDALQKAAIENRLSLQAYQRDLFTAPISKSELNKYNKVVINPPRAGALTQCEELADSKIKNICYISCNPETFARDADILLKSGYNLEEITPVDQFFWNPHLEVVALFTKV